MTSATAGNIDPAPLPRSTMIGWGLGSLGPALVMASFNVLMLRFMTDHLGIGAALAGLLIGASKLYDAVTDPLTGILSDRSRNVQGRRRPWLILGGLAMAASYVLMFAVPQLPSPATAAVYMGVMLVIYAMAYSAFNIPYLAMPAEMTQGYHERSVLMTWRVAAVALAGITANAVGLTLIERFGGGREGHAAMAMTLAPLVAISALVAWYSTRRAPFTVRNVAPSRHSPREQIRLIFANRPFVIVLGVKLLTLMMLGVQAAFPFFFNQILKVPDSVLALYFLAAQITLLVSQPLWLALSRRLGKRDALMLALAGVTGVALSWLLAAQGDPAWHMYARGFALGLAQGGVLLMGQALLPDAIEFDFHRSGLRREGLFSALYTTVETVAQALGVALVGGFLGAMGYIAGGAGLAVQPDSALLAIRISVAVVPAILCGSSLLLMLFYDLTEARLAGLRSAR